MIVDFDGVLARRNTELLLAESYALICGYRHIDPLVFKSLFTALVAFPLHTTITMLLHALGLTELKESLMSTLDKVHDGIDEALPLIAACCELDLPLRVLSSGNPGSTKYDQIRHLLGTEKVIVDPTFSKLSPADYQRTLDECAINAAECWYIDDCPAALDSAKRAGMATTIMMTNSVFRRTSAPKPGDAIDWIIDEWPELIDTLRILRS